MTGAWNKTDAALVTGILGALGVMGAVGSAVPREGIPSLRGLIVGFSVAPLLAIVMWLRRRKDSPEVQESGSSGVQNELAPSPYPLAPAMKYGVLQGALMLLPVMVVMTTTQIVWKMAGWPLKGQEILGWFMSDDASMWVRGAIVFSAVIVAPVAEEILHRGVILSTMMRHVRPWKAVVLGSLFFGVLHLNFMAIPALTLAGMFFSYGYLHTRSLLTPIVMHVVFNAANLMFVAIM